MNTQSCYPTLIPEAPSLAAPVAGTTFDRGRARQQQDPLPSLTEDERAELAVLGSRDFPSRAIYGRYLRSTFEELLAALPDGVTVTVHESSATAVRPAPDGTFGVVLADGGTLAVDSVVLALGHLASRLSPEQRQLQAAAVQLGLRYLPPAVPADVDRVRPSDSRADQRLSASHRIDAVEVTRVPISDDERSVRRRPDSEEFAVEGCGGHRQQ